MERDEFFQIIHKLLDDAGLNLGDVATLDEEERDIFFEKIDKLVDKALSMIESGRMKRKGTGTARVAKKARFQDSDDDVEN